jgi:hypothetical protein
LNDQIEKVILYQIGSYVEMYKIAQEKYGKLYDPDLKYQTIESMKKHKEMSEINEQINGIPIVTLDFFNDVVSAFK